MSRRNTWPQCKSPGRIRRPGVQVPPGSLPLCPHILHPNRQFRAYSRIQGILCRSAQFFFIPGPLDSFLQDGDSFGGKEKGFDFFCHVQGRRLASAFSLISVICSGVRSKPFKRLISRISRLNPSVFSRFRAGAWPNIKRAPQDKKKVTDKIPDMLFLFLIETSMTSSI